MAWRELMNLLETSRIRDPRPAATWDSNYESMFGQIEVTLRQACAEDSAVHQPSDLQSDALSPLSPVFPGIGLLSTLETALQMTPPETAWDNCHLEAPLKCTAGRIQQAYAPSVIYGEHHLSLGALARAFWQR